MSRRLVGAAALPAAPQDSAHLPQSRQRWRLQAAAGHAVDQRPGAWVGALRGRPRTAVRRVGRARCEGEQLNDEAAEALTRDGAD